MSASNAKGTPAGSGTLPVSQGPTGGQHCYRGGKRGNRQGGTSQEEPHTKPPAKKFTGKEDGWQEEFVYQLTSGNEASNQYARTTKELILIHQHKVQARWRCGAIPLQQGKTCGDATSSTTCWGSECRSTSMKDAGQYGAPMQSIT